MTTMGERVEQLRRLAERRQVADQVGDMPDPFMAISAYAAALNLDGLLAFNLDMTLDEIERATLKEAL